MQANTPVFQASASRLSNTLRRYFNAVPASAGGTEPASNGDGKAQQTKRKRDVTRPPLPHSPVPLRAAGFHCRYSVPPRTPVHILLRAWQCAAHPPPGMAVCCTSSSGHDSVLHILLRAWLTSETYWRPLTSTRSSIRLVLKYVPFLSLVCCGRKHGMAGMWRRALLVRKRSHSREKKVVW